MTRLKNVLFLLPSIREVNSKEYLRDVTQNRKSDFEHNSLKLHLERDCILSHGAANFLKETLQDRSDNYRLHICDDCGLVCPVNKARNIAKCKNCYLNMNKKSKTLNYSEIRVPYAMKLFIQELETMCVLPRIVTDK